MSYKELAPLEMLRGLDQGRLTASAAGDLLGLAKRQTLRLLKSCRLGGATALISNSVVALATDASLTKCAPRR